MENYKEKYEQAIEDIKKIKDANKDNKELVDFIEYKYPELKESEDEKIRKYLIDVVNDYCKGSEHDGCIAWLEKQDEQKPADKVEPKFRNGDWVVYCNEDVDLITGVGETGYIINKGGGYIPFVCEDDMRLWTIEDAKDGDVLTDGKPFIFKSINVNKHSYAYCGLSVDNAFIIESEGEYGEWTWIQDIKPASKEQCDLLFLKMKEAGYEWDPKKRELKEIEHKFAWSEDDEEYLQNIVEWVECLIDDEDCGDITYDEHKEFYMKRINWLKSLKQRMKGE